MDGEDEEEEEEEEEEEGARSSGGAMLLLCAGMCVIGLFHSEWLKPSGVALGALIGRVDWM